jgi:hypothetical protein
MNRINKVFCETGYRKQNHLAVIDILKSIYQSSPKAIALLGFRPESQEANIQ